MKNYLLAASLVLGLFLSPVQAEQKKELCLIRYPVDRLHVVLEARKLRVALAADVTISKPY